MTTEGIPTADDVRQALTAVIDPELGINIVDLGLIYDVEVEDRSIVVRYTLTTMGCGLGPVIAGQMTEVLSEFPVDDVRTELTFRPPWGPERISPEGKAFLGI
ncbi:MAG TPA: metal-sulfur cluster assembly factor [Acidimicrobiia bacterium]|nr:metal-sulfur cluster assembly factor [Acidimicrobiia bacterium]